MSEPGNKVHVSPVSGIEVAIKHRLGRLPHADELVPHFRPMMESRGFHVLTVSLEHALRAGSYPGEHRDPFDRLLAAQAELDGLILLTRDREFAGFPCQTLW
jgi:PIN domain nuclease of toxin-antitoxin system